MPKLLSSIRAFWPLRHSRPELAAEPDWEPNFAAASTSPEPVRPAPAASIAASFAPNAGTLPQLAQLKPEEILAARAALDSLMHEVFDELKQNRADQESLLKAYEAQNDEATRRTFARQFQYVKSKECQLEERHEELTSRLQLWDSVSIQMEKVQWQEGKLNATKQPAVDLASLHVVMQSTIAHGEESRQQIKETLDMFAAAADKAKVRRDFGVQTTMAEMDKQLLQQREAKALAQQNELADLANGVDMMLNQPLAAKQPVRMKGGA